jgi:D-amino-acid oxidase
LEKYDEVTYKRFGQLIDGGNVHGCKAVQRGEGNELGLGRMGKCSRNQDSINDG